MNLQELHYKYGAGKGKFLMARYEELFKDLKDKDIRLLELGIYKGGSLRMWRDYFSKGKIAGFDRNPQWMINGEPRISTLCIDQKDIPNIGKETFFDFDIIIDDCSHIGSLTRKSFRYLFDNHLKSGGIYVIEDWHTGYRNPVKKGGEIFDYEGIAYVEGNNHLSGMAGFVKELIDELAIKKKIERIIYFESIIFVYKK